MKYLSLQYRKKNLLQDFYNYFVFEDLVDLMGALPTYFVPECRLLISLTNNFSFRLNAEEVVLVTFF
jgi:hypothetical protein